MKVALLFPGGVRQIRLQGSQKLSNPREFFYGKEGIERIGYKTTLIDSRADPKNLSQHFMRFKERAKTRFSGFSLCEQRVEAIREQIVRNDFAVSFTDNFSLSLGFLSNTFPKNTILVGGFHGLADIEDGIPSGRRKHVHNMIIECLAGLEHVFFFGKADMEESRKKYDLSHERSSLFPFGIDIDFWNNCKKTTRAGVLAVGSDLKRDYETLLEADIEAPMTILTKLKIDSKKIKSDVTIASGSLHGSNITDQKLRDMYHSAAVVAVPTRDVWQPSGYSVSLQAMACGCPIVLSDTKGLWDRELFLSEENCILVPPNDPIELSKAINKLLVDKELNDKIGMAGFITAKKHFSLHRMEKGLCDLINDIKERKVIL